MVKYIAVTLALLVAAGAVAAAMNRRFLVGYWQYGRQARVGDLQVGDLAPDVPVMELDGSTVRSLGQSFGSRPVVLIFGSFT